MVPDYFGGDPYNPSNQDRPIPVWIKDHGCVRSSSSPPYNNCPIHSQLLFEVLLTSLTQCMCYCSVILIDSI